jgi:hypothetical protein
VYTQVSKSQSTPVLQPLNVILTLCFAEGRISGFHRSLKMFHSAIAMFNMTNRDLLKVLKRILVGLVCTL